MKRITYMIIAMLLIVVAVPAQSFADIKPTVHDDTTVRVYLTISYDSEFLRAGSETDLTKRTGKVLARVPVDISYTDLAEYGLEGYYRYDSIDEEYGSYDSSAIAVKPTVLMLYLRATSLYYLGREISWKDIGNKENGTESSTLTVSGGAQHLYFTRFWGHSENLMYYVNHEFPMWYADQGATADYIILEEGDEIDVGMFSNMSFHTFGAFAYFDQTNPVAAPGDKLDMSLLSTATHEGSEPGEPMPGETIRISKDYGETWETTDLKTGDDGSFSISFDDPGIYYVSAGPDFIKNVNNQMACVVPPIAVVEIRPVQVAGGKTFNPDKDKVICKWDDQGENVTYKVDYRNTGDTTWKTTEVTEPEITVDDVDPEKCEFRITAIVRSEYVPYGESPKKLNAKASPVIRHSGYVPPAEDPDEQELAEAKQNAITELQSYRSPDLYREAEQIELASIVKTGIDAINAAIDMTGVQTAYGDAVSRIDALKTKAQYEAEEQGQGGEQDDPAVKALAEAKNNAKIELDLYMAPSEYRDAERASLLQLLTEGKEAIDKAETEDAVKALLTEYKSKIDQMKTDAEYAAEEEAARQEEERKRKEQEEEQRAAEEKRKAEILAAKIKAAKEAKPKVTAKALKKHKAKISWKKVTLSYKAAGETGKLNVTGYKIYRATKKAGKYKLIKTIKKAGTLKYTDKKLKKGKKYFYKVRTYTKINGETYLGKWSAVKKIRGR